MRQTLFIHLIRPNLSCFYYNSNLFFGRNDSTDFYDFFGQFLQKFGFTHKPISQRVLNLPKNKQHFLKFALFFIKDAKNHRNRLIFIAFNHAAVEKTHLFKVFFWLVFSLYRMVMRQRKLPRTARREWRPSSSLRDNRKPQMIYTSVWKGISF